MGFFCGKLSVNDVKNHFSERIRTGSSPADIKRFRSHFGKAFLQFLVVILVFLNFYYFKKNYAFKFFKFNIFIVSSNYLFL